MADKSTSDGEKTFEVIIGLLAGVALLIVFLTFIRKMLEFRFILLFEFGRSPLVLGFRFLAY